MRDWITRLLTGLRTARVDLTAEDVADAVWLTPYLTAPEAGPEALVEEAPPEEFPGEAPEPIDDDDEDESGAAPAPMSLGGPSRGAGRRGELHLPGGTRAGHGGRPLTAPTGSALPGALALTRALRPLRRRVPSRLRRVLDVAETVRRVAEEGVWLPALRPAHDRWLDLSFVVDVGPSMGPWRSTAAELLKLLAGFGAFRAVRVWSLETEASPPRLRAGLGHRPGAPARDPRELIDPSGRSLTLVLTDAVSDAWYDGGAARLLETWARSGPIGLLQVLPEHLWSRTAFGAAEEIRVSTHAPAAANARLEARPVGFLTELLDRPGSPLPVTSLVPEALSAWARLVAGLGGAEAAGLLLDLEPPPPPAAKPRLAPPPELRLQRFWRSASPTARRLAGLLAASPVISLPVIRLVRQALLPEARQVHEAEVLLGDLLRVIAAPGEPAGAPDEVRYDFRDGLRPLLLDAVPTADALGVLEQVSSYIAEHLGSGAEFRAVLADPASARGSFAADESPFARVAAEVLLRLGGDYARLVASEPAEAPSPEPEVPLSSSGAAKIVPPGRVGSAPPLHDPPPLPGAAPRRSEGLQKKLDRVRRPRVHITYDVEAGGTLAKYELPFVIGVLADLSGHPTDRLPRLASRKFVEVDRDSFAHLLNLVAPRLALKLPHNQVRNEIALNSDELAVDLQFRSLDDFRPAGVASQIPPLAQVLQERRDLAAKLHAGRGIREALGDQTSDIGLMTGPFSDDEAIDRGDSISTGEAATLHRIRQLDEQLSVRLRAILHHPDFRRLEGSWRGLHYLIQQAETGPSLKIRVLNVSKHELLKDMGRAPELDQIALFKRVYEEEYGTVGGQPYSLLIGDYDFSQAPQDVELLALLSNVAGAAHAPFVASASPAMFGMTSFTELWERLDLAKIFDTAEAAKWRAFRDSEDSRYVGLTLPRILSRLPYGPDTNPIDEFLFDEGVESSRSDHFVWMSAAWALAARVADAMARDGWPARIRGVEWGGRVDGLPTFTFPSDDGGIAWKCPTEVALSDRREYELSSLGFLPLVHEKDTDHAAFFSVQSCQRPRLYDKEEATANARLSARLDVVLCVSRFAHYLKAMMRDKLGSFMGREDCETFLGDWLRQYVAQPPAEKLAPELRARFPLHDARLTVVDDPARPGSYRAVVYLRPHYQIEELMTSIRLVVDLPAASQ